MACTKSITRIPFPPSPTFYPYHRLQPMVVTASTRLRLCLCALSMSQANYGALLTAILHATCALSIRHVARMSAAMFTQKKKYKMKQNR